MKYSVKKSSVLFVTSVYVLILSLGIALVSASNQAHASEPVFCSTNDGGKNTVCNKYYEDGAMITTYIRTDQDGNSVAQTLVDTRENQQ